MSSLFDDMFKDYPEVLNFKELKSMLNPIGKNKLYGLLKDGKIYSKRIGNNYYIPKKSVIIFLLQK